MRLLNSTLTITVSIRFELLSHRLLYSNVGLTTVVIKTVESVFLDNEDVVPVQLRSRGPTNSSAKL